MNQRTQKNLVTAMHGEAFAFVKYMLFTEYARKNDLPELVDLFEETAHVERFEHLAEEAELAIWSAVMPTTWRTPLRVNLTKSRQCIKSLPSWLPPMATKQLPADSLKCAATK